MAEGQSTSRWVVLAAVGLAVLVTAIVVFQQGGPSPSVSATALNEEQRGYLRQLVVTDARMSAAENFLGDTVTYLDARITNRGERPVRRVQVEMQFVDVLNQVVLRQTAYAVSERTPPLKPGETRGFRVSFEHMPADWSQSPPSMRVTNVSF